MLMQGPEKGHKKSYSTKMGFTAKPEVAKCKLTSRKKSVSIGYSHGVLHKSHTPEVFLLRSGLDLNLQMGRFRSKSWNQGITELLRLEKPSKITESKY